MTGTIEAWLQQVYWARNTYRLPPRAHEQARALIDDALALLFPHLAHERRCEPEAILGEVADLHDRVSAFLRDKGRPADEAKHVADRFVQCLPHWHDMLMLDAQATFCRGEGRRRSGIPCDVRARAGPRASPRSGPRGPGQPAILAWPT